MSDTTVNVEELRRGGVVALKEKDLYSVWVKTACCNLGSEQIRKLADIADKYGRGFLLFSSRQIPIIPFVHINRVTEVKQELARVEMELDRCGSRVRNLNVCYEDKICPQAAVNCVSLGEKLESFFASRILHKIKIGIAGCGMNCNMVRTLNDIGFIGTQAENFQGYDAYAGGRLGLNPFVGVKIAGPLKEDECVKVVQNYFTLLEQQGRPGERSADVMQRLGIKAFERELTRDLHQKEDLPVISCPSKREKAQTGKMVLKIRAICGEVTSEHLRKLADIADRFGYGFVHFSVRGSPEIPGVDIKQVAGIRRELADLKLRMIDNEVENLQSCFGNYCAESIADPQKLLRRIEARLGSLALEGLKITVSASGCPNSCGIAHLSDIGFHGVVEPAIDTANCSGCGLCPVVCKRKAIEIKNNLAMINGEKCGHCGQCFSVCPFNAIREMRKGMAVLLGGRGEKEPHLGTKIAEFIQEDAALEIAENLFMLARDRNKDVGKLIDELGIDRIKEMIVPDKDIAHARSAGEGRK